MDTPTEPLQVELLAEKVRKRTVDPGPGRHLWMFVVTFRASDDLIGRLLQGDEPGQVLFDHENMMSANGPGCFKCERQFTPQLAAAPCRGSMYA